MAKRNNKQSNPAARLLILLAVIGVPLIFVLAIFSTDLVVERAPYLLLVIMAVVMIVYSGTTAGLLYKYYETSAPWYRFIPCFGELTLMDSKYLKIGTVFYIFAAIFFGLSRLPYDVMKVVGEGLVFSLPFYLTVLTFIAMLGVEIVKGIGMLNCMKIVSDEWEEKMHTSLGFIKSFAWLGFIPFVRVLTIYGLNKPLSTLVTFNDYTVSDSDDVVLDEEEGEPLV